jgi:hypothetical protein
MSLAGIELKGIHRTPRVMDILDVHTAATISDLKRKGPDAVKDCMKNMFSDVSQQVGRKCCTNKDGISHCLTTSTELYSYALDSVVLPMELMQIQGHSSHAIVPQTMKPRELRDLAGEGMNLPCLGTVLWAMYLVKQYP